MIRIFSPNDKIFTSNGDAVLSLLGTAFWATT